jgi:hypothetical protein
LIRRTRKIQLRSQTALAAIQARLASAALVATQPDGATISITVTI